MIALSIDQLNESERTVISLYYYEELKLKEIAEILNLRNRGFRRYMQKH